MAKLEIFQIVVGQPFWVAQQAQPKTVVKKTLHNNQAFEPCLGDCGSDLQRMRTCSGPVTQRAGGRILGLQVRVID
jgi:hypothetical protein